AGKPLPRISRFGEEPTVQVLEVQQPPAWPPGLRALPAARVQEAVLRNAGARPWERDEIDRRIVADVVAGTGSIIDSEEAVGGYPKHAETRRALDPAEWDLRSMTRRA
ncbi:MAG TPA: hypothetical protein VF699_01695, partial [Caulobacteraceae bacterium]